MSSESKQPAPAAPVVPSGASAKDRTERIQVLSREECLELLATTTVGRIAFADSDGPQLVPVNFTLIRDAVYFRTLPHGFLSQLRGGPHPAAFGVDHHDEAFQTGWNVTIRGSASQVEDRATINSVLGHPSLRPWAGGVRPMVMRVTIDSIDGRRVWGAWGR